jgi:hypothetical protein
MSGQSTGMAGDDTVWQGYVSAIACLLLALLLLMSILALAIVLGNSAEQDDPAPEAAPQTETQTEAEKPADKAPAPKAIKPGGQAPQWVLRFPKDTWRFTKKQREDLAAQFAAAQAAGQGEWRAWVQMPTETPAGSFTEAGSSREAYLRLLAVRDLLQAAGIKPEQIDLRIFSEAGSVKSAIEASDATVLLAKTGKPAEPAKAVSTAGEVP